MSSDASIAEVPLDHDPSVATFSPGRTTKRSPTTSSPIGTRRSAPSLVEHGDVLGAELEQCAQRGAGAALGAGLEVATGEDERDDRRGDLEVDLVGAGPPFERSDERIVIAGSPASPKNSAHSDQPYAASTPIEISVSIVAARGAG